MSTLHQIGYCTNVHAGASLAQTQENLTQHALDVKRQFSPDSNMGVGLWLSAVTAKDLLQGNELPAFRDWLAESGLVPFTLNGFPFGDFHQPVVKHRVYEPTWMEQDRLGYTLDLVRILDTILPTGIEGSISTLPIGWGAPALSADQWHRSTEMLAQLAESLRQLEDSSGRLIHVNIEPEPGCVFQYSSDVVNFFNEHISGRGDEEVIRRYIRVCHDVCHADVMFEDQVDVFKKLADANVLVGKVQVSSAVHLPLAKLPSDDRAAALQQLGEFAEDRYLHQTVLRSAESGETTFYEDLPLALKACAQDDDVEEMRVHFHVPIYLEQFGLLGTSRSEIVECLRAAEQYSEVTHFEVETYAWGVLPNELKQPSLATGIAQELAWFQATMGN